MFSTGSFFTKLYINLSWFNPSDGWHLFYKIIQTTLQQNVFPHRSAASSSAMWRTTYKIAISTVKFRGKQQTFPSETAKLSFLTVFFVFTFCHTDSAQSLLTDSARQGLNCRQTSFLLKRNQSHLGICSKETCIWLTDAVTGAFLGIFSSFKQVTTRRLKCHSSGRSFQVT